MKPWMWIGKREKRTLHVLKDLVAVVLVWRAVWGLADEIFSQDKFAGYIICGIVGLVILYFDNFRLDEFGH